MPKLTSNKTWQQSDDLLKQYPVHVTVHVGIMKVKTEGIVGLSFAPETLINDDKMKTLIESVERNGWNDPLPQDLHLYKLPTGKYIVGSGGNHRTLLASEFGLPSIKASVDILMPIDTLLPDVISEIEDAERTISELEEKARGLAQLLRSKGIYRDDYIEENKQYEAVFPAIDLAYRRREVLLRNEAVRLGLLDIE